MRRRILLVVCLLSHATPALAGDGRIEINHATALAGAVTGSLADDPAGYPVRITRSGSYVLTGDLTVGDVAAGGILIAPGADDVTIDLGGFTIRGPSATVGEPANACGVQGAGMGIRALPSTSPPTARNVVVRDGRVSRFGNTGIDLSGDGSRVEGVQASENCGLGIALGDSAHLEDIQSTLNLANGINCGVACRVARSTARGNGGQGIRPLSDSIVSESSAIDNAQQEIRGFESTLVIGTLVAELGDASMKLEEGSLVVGVNASGSVSNFVDVGGAAAGGVAYVFLPNQGGYGWLPLACVGFQASVLCP